MNSYQYWKTEAYHYYAVEKYFQVFVRSVFQYGTETWVLGRDPTM